MENERLARILKEIYPGRRLYPWYGNGKVGDGLRNELATGDRTRGVYHALDVAELFKRFAVLLGEPRPDVPARAPVAHLTPRDRDIALQEAGELWSALSQPDRTGALDRWFREVPDRRTIGATTLRNAVMVPEMRSITRGTFEPRPGRPAQLVALPPLRGIAGSLLEPFHRTLRVEAVNRELARAMLENRAPRTGSTREPRGEQQRSAGLGKSLELGLGG